MKKLTTYGLGRAGAVLLLGALVLPATGAEWLPDQELVPGAAPAYTLSNSGRSADMDPSGSIHVVFQSHLDTDTFQVDYTFRTAGGEWAEPALISADANARNASLVSDGAGGIHVVWENVSSSRGQVEYRHRSPDGVWSEITPLSDGTGLVEDPVIRVDAFERIHVAWVDGRSGAREILYCRRDSDGDWGESRLLSVGGGAPSEPSMAADGLGVVHVVWRDRIGIDRPAGFFNFEIFYLRLGPEELPLIQPERLTHDLGVSRSPFIETNVDGTVHVVWADNRHKAGSTEFEVYYRRYLHGVGWTHEKRFTYDGTDHGQPVIVAGRRTRSTWPGRTTVTATPRSISARSRSSWVGIPGPRGSPTTIPPRSSRVW